MIRQRIISAVFIAVLLVSAVLLLPAFWSAVALSAILLLAAWEWSGFLRTPHLGLRGVFVAAAVTLCALWWQFTASATGLQLALWCGLAFWALATLWVFTLPQRINGMLVGLAGLIALSLAWLALVRMRVDFPHGAWLVLYSLLIVWLADSGAYFAGRSFGVRKLAPAVSPGKTWAGMGGGLIACALLAAGASWLAQVPFLPLLLVTLVVGVFSVTGDLTESLCKRFAGLKDSGALIPGHGGVLDRFDSLLAAAPLLMLGLHLFPELRG